MIEFYFQEVQTLEYPQTFFVKQFLLCVIEWNENVRNREGINE